MLKKRIIPIQLVDGSRLVKSINFENFRDVGDPVSSTRIYNSQYADEIIILNISRNRKNVTQLLSILDQVSRVAFMPIACGGGIKTADEATKLISSGADKVILNSILYEKYDVITDIAHKHGSQAVIACIDVRLDSETGGYELYSNNGLQKEKVSLQTHCKKLCDFGVGEVMIQSISNDGMMNGYDIELVKLCRSYLSVPVIAAGGSNSYEGLLTLFEKTDVSAAACGSIFNFSDSNLLRAKSFLKNYDIPMKKV